MHGAMRIRWFLRLGAYVATTSLVVGCQPDPASNLTGVQSSGDVLTSNPQSPIPARGTETKLPHWSRESDSSL